MTPTPIPGERSHDGATSAQRGTSDVVLGWDEVVLALGELAGARVAVRIVERSDPESLITAFRGHLGRAPRDKHPTLFWPTHAESEHEHDDIEHTGIYLCRDRFEPSAGSPGRSVLHIVQGLVIVNVRRL